MCSRLLRSSHNELGERTCCIGFPLVFYIPTLSLFSMIGRFAASKFNFILRPSDSDSLRDLSSFNPMNREREYFFLVEEQKHVPVLQNLLINVL